MNNAVFWITLSIDKVIRFEYSEYKYLNASEDSRQFDSNHANQPFNQT
jgi:hypothetical protein